MLTVWVAQTTLPPRVNDGRRPQAEDDVAGAYADATDSTRQLLRVRNADRQEHRIKPDPETHPEAEFDYEKKTGSSLSRHLEMMYVAV